MLSVFEFLKISISDLIETLGLVLAKPWQMAAAVYRGGNSTENALLYFFALYSASLLIFLLTFELEDEFARFAQHFTVTAFLFLMVTSVTFFVGLRLAGIPIPYYKALTIKAFVDGAYVLVHSVSMALATARINSSNPDELQNFGAMALGCVPMIDLSNSVPVIVAPYESFWIYAGIAFLSFALNAYLFAGVFVGLAPFRSRNRFVYVLIALAIFAVDYKLGAELAGRNMYLGTQYCKDAQVAAGLRMPDAEDTGQ